MSCHFSSCHCFGFDVNCFHLSLVGCHLHAVGHMWTHWTMYATVFTVVMVLQFNLSTVFHCSFFGMSWNVLGCLGMFLGCLGTSCI